MAATYFDTHHEQMAAVTASDGIRRFCYRQQVALLESLITPGMTVLDVGCGPSLPYRADHAYIIGLDPSAESLAVNTDVDDRIVGTATAIPLPDTSVDLVVALYAVHHMTGQSPRETGLIRAQALSEMERVVKPGGQVLVFEMAPNPLARWAQDLLWPLAKAILGDRLDTYFWGDEELRIPAEAQTFDCSPFTVFAPILSLPWFRVPRFLYPLTPTLYKWSI